MGATKSAIIRLEKKTRDTVGSELVVIATRPTPEETEDLMEEARQLGKTPISIDVVLAKKYGFKLWDGNEC